VAINDGADPEAPGAGFVRLTDDGALQVDAHRPALGIVYLHLVGSLPALAENGVDEGDDLVLTRHRDHPPLPI
jgi:hypothetical protein